MSKWDDEFKLLHMATIELCKQTGCTLKTGPRSMEVGFTYEIWKTIEDVDEILLYEVAHTDCKKAIAKCAVLLTLETEEGLQQAANNMLSVLKQAMEEVDNA